MNKTKRTWHYLLKPSDYEVCCNVGGKPNKHKVTWSEYEGMIWCFKCKRDMEGSGGIFDGPIPWETTKLILGNYAFHRFNLVKQVVEAPVYRKNRIDYRACPALTKKLLRNKN